MELVLDGEGRLRHVFCPDAMRSISRLVEEGVTQSELKRFSLNPWRNWLARWEPIIAHRTNILPRPWP